MQVPELQCVVCSTCGHPNVLISLRAKHSFFKDSHADCSYVSAANTGQHALESFIPVICDTVKHLFSRCKARV